MKRYRFIAICTEQVEVLYPIIRMKNVKIISNSFYFFIEVDFNTEESIEHIIYCMSLIGDNDIMIDSILQYNEYMDGCIY